MRDERQTSPVRNSIFLRLPFARFNRLGIRYPWQSENQPDFAQPASAKHHDFQPRMDPSHLQCLQHDPRGNGSHDGLRAVLSAHDMCKAADKGIVIEQIHLEYKAGGKSGEWRNH